MKEIIRRAIAGSSADYTEVRVERRWLHRVRYQRTKLETLESATELGGVVRCLQDGGWGISGSRPVKWCNGIAPSSC
jgi:predicted Zn-dependent protease